MFASKQTLYVFLLQIISMQLLVANVTSGQVLEEVKVEIHVQNASLRQVFEIIEKQTSFAFIYRANAISESDPYSFDYKEVSVAEILDKVSEQGKYHFHRINDNISVVKIKSKEGTESEHLQGRTIQGKVTDFETGEPIIGATIQVKGTTIGTLTDIDGHFSFDIADSNIKTLLIAHVGYSPVEVEASVQSTFNIQLKQNVLNLEEVVVVGYGTVKKKDVTGSISSVSSAEIQERGVTSFDQLMQGMVPGLQVSQNSNAPGGGISVRVRGTNSITAGSEPLYVIDGVPLYNNNLELSPDEPRGNRNRIGAPKNALSFLNPSDIESIQVLKDASATAIYGTRGANGVIIVTTKRGISEKTQVDLEYSYGVQQVLKELPVMSTQQFTKYINEAYVNAGKPAPFVPEGNLKNTNWQKEIFRKGIQQSIQTSVSKAGDTYNYRMSMGHFNQEGIIKNSAYQRTNFRLNLDKTISKKVKTGTKFTVVGSRNNAVTTGSDPSSGTAGVVSKALFMSPTLSVKQDGKYTNHSDAYSEAADYIWNPVADVQKIQNDIYATRLFGSVFAEYSPISSLKLRANVGGDMSFTRRELFWPTVTERGTSAPNGLGMIAHVNGQQWLQEYTADYSIEKGNHSINALGGITHQINTIRGFATEATGFTIESFGVNNLKFGTKPQNSRSSIKKRELLSYLSRITYVYDSKYYLTLTGRVDGSSVFGANNKYAFFPALAFAWNITNEPFLRDHALINHFKIRASYGLTGNQEIPPYQSLGGVVIKFYNGPNLGMSPDEISNNDLRWEKTTQANVGFDALIWNDRLEVSMDAYHKKTTDLLLERDIPFISGDREIIENIGVIENKGFEISLLAHMIKNNPGFEWTLGTNLSSNKNKVVSLIDETEQLPIIPPNGFINSPVAVLKVGQSIGTFYGYKFLKVDENKRVYEDTDNNGEVDADDRVAIGNPQPKFIFGINSTLRFKNMDISLLVQGVQGNELLNMNKIYSESMNGNYNQLVSAIDDPTVLKPNLNNTLEPISDRLVEDGSFIRLKNVTLGYTIPIQGEGAFIKNIRLYATGYNLITMTNYSGYDPEVNSFGQASNSLLGVDFGSYPNHRKYLFGVKLNF